MRHSILSLAASLLVAFLMPGCATSGPGKKIKGRIASADYCPAKNLESGWGAITVVFAHDGGPTPDTNWRLVGANGPEPEQCVPGHLPKRTDSYGLTFAFPKGDGKAAACYEPPDPRMMTVLEKQLLTVTISYK